MALSTFFHKPELALRRAYELEGINQDEAALSLLHEVLSSRRHRTWSPSYEQIMIAYLDMCLKSCKSREAKDGLHQYRNLSQSQAPGSLEKVIRYLMDKAEATCTRAAKKLALDNAAKATFLQQESGGGGGTSSGSDDNDFGASPQAILLSTMSTDPAKSQRDSAILLPSLKFLWETYRAVLDILRSNSKLEHVYHAAAQNALRFCRTYQRRMEFRHLCDMLRMHLGNLRQYGSHTIQLTPDAAGGGDELTTKGSSKLRGWEGWTSESIELHLQTRFQQLETASLLHRYTEGFRTCEDIFNILQISQARRKVNPDVPPPKAKLMASYYEKLTTLFWVSENYLFHAFAWYKYYSLCKEYNARGMSAEMKQMQASAVLLAALCIPTIPEQSGVTTNQQHGITSTVEDDIVQQKMARMATLLGFHTRNPTRQALLAEIKSKNILAQVPQYLRDLYYLLEENSDPLIMVQQAQPLLEQLKKEVGNTTTTDEHNDDVHDTTLGRYVTPLANVLLLKLVVNLTNAYHTVSMDFLKKLTAGLDMSFEQVEKSIVLFTQSKTLSVRVDHRAGCLRFGNTQLESDAMRSQLTVLAKQLQAVSTHVLVIPQAISKAEQEAIQAAVKAEEERHHAVYASVRAQLPAEHENVLRRKFLIEQRKERDELEAQNKIREEQRIKAEEEAARKKEDEARILREKRLREQEKQRKIQQEMENREKIRFLAAMNKNTEDFSEEQLAAIDTEALQREHQEKINKKKEEAERKTREAAKKLDYLVRAIRIEELPVIKQKYEDKIKKDRERYEQETIEKVKMAKVQWEADVTDKAILEEHGVFECMAEFEAVVMKGRKVQYDDICAQANRDAEVEAERAKLRRARKRKEDEAKRIADEEKRRKEEEANQKLEEQNRLKEKARLEKEAKEEEHRQAEVRRMDEERRKKEAAEPPAPRGSGGGGSGGGGNSRYVPPSKRGGAGDSGGGGGGGGDRARPRFGGSEYPGGGRYQGGGGGDRGGGDRRGGYGDGGGDRRGGGGGGFRSRDGDGGGRDDRGGGGGGGSGDRGRSDGDRGSSGGNTRWR